MPKPLLLARPSGVYARFLVPKDLRALVGSRFLVRPLHAPFGDVARLVAARMGMALSQAFQALRQGQAVDIDEVLRRVRRNGVQQLILKGITFPNGAGVTEVEIKTPEDMAFWRETLEKMASADPVESIGLLPEHFLLKQQEVHAKREATDRSVGPSLSKAIENHLTDLTNAKLQPKTVLESRHTLRLFAGVVGEDLPVSELSQDHVREFFSAIRWWPSNASKRPAYRGMPVLEVMALAKANDEPEPAAWTIKKHRQRLSVFFISLVEAKRLDVNPLAGVRAVATPDEEDRGSPFTDNELGAIFGSAFVPWASKYPHRWFGPMLGLYSGARVNEVAQLRVDDIATVDGVPGFYVRVVANGQRIKSKHSRRFVPLAQPVLEAGFLDYVQEAKAAGHVQLFPNLPNSTGLGFGRQLSRQFSTYIKRQGVEEKGQGFHGFRHTLADRLDAAGASPAAIGAVTGHAAGQTVLEKHYIHRSTLPDRVATLGKFSPPVVLPRYQPGQFDLALRSAEQKLLEVGRRGGKKKAPR